MLKGSIREVQLSGQTLCSGDGKEYNKTNCTSRSRLAFRLEIPLFRDLLTPCSRKNTQVITYVVRAKHLALALPLLEVTAYVDTAYVGSDAQYPDGGCSCFSLVPPGTVT